MVLRDHHIDPIDEREVDPADPAQFPTQIELRRIPTGFLTCLGRLRLAGGFGLVFHGPQMRRQRFIAFLDALLIGDIGLQLLAQDKQQLRSPVPLQTLRNFLFAGLDVRIGQCREFVPVALAP